MKKKKLKLITLLFPIIIFSSPFLIYFLVPETVIYHPSEIVFKNKKEETFLTTINEKKGKYTEYNNISKSFIKNLITIEDKRFFKQK